MVKYVYFIALIMCPDNLLPILLDKGSYNNYYGNDLPRDEITECQPFSRARR